MMVRKTPYKTSWALYTYDSDEQLHIDANGYGGFYDFSYGDRVAPELGLHCIKGK
jgi:hypothetical protein